MPNSKVLEEKRAYVAELADKLKNSASGVIVDYKGIDVASDTKLRENLRKNGVEYNVVKNTMLRFAAKEIGYDELESVLSGTTAIAVSSDPVAPAKILSEFASKNENFKIKAGFVEGRVIDVDGVKQLAELPSRDVLIAQVVGGMNAPISGLVRVLNGTLRNFVVALDKIAEQKSAS